jgi:hypothetical protein
MCQCLKLATNEYQVWTFVYTEYGSPTMLHCHKYPIEMSQCCGTLMIYCGSGSYWKIFGSSSGSGSGSNSGSRLI